MRSQRSAFLQYLEVHQQAWKSFCTEVATRPAIGNVADLAHFYADDVDQPLMTPDLAQSALIIDAFVVVAFFIWKFTRLRGPQLSAPKNLVRQTIQIFTRANGIGVQSALDNDIFWLCENQIPLFLVENIWNKVASHAGVHRMSSFHSVLSWNLRCILTNSGLPFRDPEDKVARLDSSTCDHLLQCLHKAIWPDGAPPRTTEAETSNNTCMNRWTLKQLVTFGSTITSTLRGLLNRNITEATFPATGAPTTTEAETSNNTCMNRWKRRRILKQLVTFGSNRKLTEPPLHLPSALPSASELHKSGIRFRGTDGGDIRLVKSFHRLTAILYVPKLIIATPSEKRLRNMCVYELITGQSKAPGSWYVHFMDELINEEEDLRLLLHGKQPVITANYMGDNKVVVAVFTNVLQNFSLIAKDPHRKVKAEISNWYRNRWRHYFVGFLDRFVRAPWLFVSLVAATILVVLTLLQTIFTMWGFYNQY
ncbi:hypothetical protein R1sor_026673 [Riccia sorocarpa]|uniref:Uncharacterized protein n=1 Tax=Riccia sorocarpa TaxID=122646 RepID=A0ABD3GC42_9MARC